MNALVADLRKPWGSSEDSNIFLYILKSVFFLFIYETKFSKKFWHANCFLSSKCLIFFRIISKYKKKFWQEGFFFFSPECVKLFFFFHASNRFFSSSGEFSSFMCENMQNQKCCRRIFVFSHRILFSLQNFFSHVCLFMKPLKSFVRRFFSRVKTCQTFSPYIRTTLNQMETKKLFYFFQVWKTFFVCFVFTLQPSTMHLKDFFSLFFHVWKHAKPNILWENLFFLFVFIHETNENVFS